MLLNYVNSDDILGKLMLTVSYIEHLPYTRVIGGARWRLAAAARARAGGRFGA